MNSNEYVKFMTQEITTYIDLSADEKKLRRSKHKKQPSPYSNRWLGVLPFALKILTDKKTS